MKNLIKAITLITFLSFGLLSCEGPAGPPGADGFDGLDGLDAEFTTIYEIGGINFTAENDYNYNEIIPEDIDVFDTDIVMVYRLINNDEEVGDIWEALPTVYFLDQGIMQFSFDFSIDDVSIDLTADFDRATLDTNFTDEQVFRFAIIPAVDNLSAKTIDNTMSYEEVSKNAVLIKL